MDLSVVIPTYNRADTLERCLFHLANQTLDPARYEVIVADDASSDDTASVVERTRPQVPYGLRYRRCVKGYASGARNRGAEWARAPRLVFLGDDILATPGLLQTHLDAAATLGADSVFVGEVRLAEPRSPFMQFLEADGVHHAFGRMAVGEATGWMFYACNASVPAVAHRAVGGFNERLTKIMEDGEYGMRLHRAGYPLRFLPDARAVHVHPMTVDRYVRFLREGRDDAAAVARWAAAIGEPVKPHRASAVTRALVDDAVAWQTARWLGRVDRLLAPSIRAKLYRGLIRYERRRAVEAGEAAA